MGPKGLHFSQVSRCWDTLTTTGLDQPQGDQPPAQETEDRGYDSHHLLHVVLRTIILILHMRKLRPVKNQWLVQNSYVLPD